MPRDMKCSEDVDMGTDRIESDREQELADKLFKSTGRTENVNEIDAALKATEPLPLIERPRWGARQPCSGRGAHRVRPIPARTRGCRTSEMGALMRFFNLLGDNAPDRVLGNLGDFNPVDDDALDAARLEFFI